LQDTCGALQQGHRKQQQKEAEMGGLSMKAAIEAIIIKERIRKEITRIPELAADIEKNGLINPVTVMSLDSGRFQLLAGLRRVKAAQSLGWPEIEVNVVSLADAEAAIHIEYSENEQREQFTYSEKMDYSRLVEVIEKEKAKERKAEGQSRGGATAGNGRNKQSCLGDARPASNSVPPKQRVRDIVGEKIGMSGKQYERAKYVAENATQDVIEQIDRGERTIFDVHDELKAKEKTTTVSTEPQELIHIEAEDVMDAEDEPTEEIEPEDESPPPQAEPQKTSALPQAEPEEKPAPKAEIPQKPKANSPKTKLPSDGLTEEEIMERLNFSEKDKEESRKAQAFNAMTPEEKVVELKRQLKELRVRTVTAESDLATLRLNHGITVDHKDSLIEYLKKQNTDLTEALTAANEKIAEMEVRQ
jgi:ParB family chromosome partitioning protein